MNRFYVVSLHTKHRFLWYENKQMTHFYVLFVSKNIATYERGGNDSLLLWYKNILYMYFVFSVFSIFEDFLKNNLWERRVVCARP